MLCNVMLCYMVICIAPLTGGYSEALSAWQAGETESDGCSQMALLLCPTLNQHYLSSQLTYSQFSCLISQFIIYLPK